MQKANTLDERAQRLLDEIEAGAFEGGSELPRALKKCLALGGFASSIQLRDWAAKELNGYGNEDMLPDYRRLFAPLAVDAFVGNGWITGQQISVWDLPEVCRDVLSGPVNVTSSISEIVHTLGHSEGQIKLQHSGMPDAAKIWNAESKEPFQRIERIYWTASRSAYSAIVDAVATKLVQLVAEIRAATPAGDQPTDAAVDQAFNVAIHGAKRSNITITAALAGEKAALESPQQPDTIGHRLARWEVIVGIVGVIVAVVAIMLT
jgi:hypothetical protein